MDRVSELNHDGLWFDVFDEGPMDGEIVVLLHGFPERSTTWHAVAPRLHAAGYRTIAMDQRGYSPGARPPRRRDYAISRLVSDVAALMGELDRPVHLVGHDWGALVAWLVAAEHPEAVRTLTAVSVPHPAAFLRAVFTGRQGLHSWYMVAFQLPWLPEWVLKRTGVLRRFGMTFEEVGRFRREIVSQGALRGGLMWYRALSFTDPRSVRRPVRVPTTLVWSDGDVAISRAAVGRTGDYVNAPYEFVTLTGVSHWIPTQAPEALVEAMVRRLGSGDAPSPQVGVE